MERFYYVFVSASQAAGFSQQGITTGPFSLAIKIIYSAIVPLGFIYRQLVKDLGDKTCMVVAFPVVLP